MKFKYPQPHLFKQEQPVQTEPKAKDSDTPTPNETQVRNACKYLLFSFLSQYI